MRKIEITGYDVETQLHVGRKTKVFKGKRLEDNLPVVIKTHSQEEYPGEYEVNQLRREFEYTKKIESSEVISVLDLVKVGAGVAIIEEDIEGESLDKHLEKGPFSFSEFLKIALQICDGLEKIHGADIVHKDINPSNVIYNHEKKKVKIIDFGISTELSGENIQAQLPNLLEGTLSYISPEQTGRMNRQVDYRTDLYSLGATFYHLLTKCPPFETDDTMEMIHCHIAKQPKSPVEIDEKIPVVLSQIIMKLMEKRAEERYQSAFSLKRDLLTCLQRIKMNEGGEERIPPFEIAVENFSDRFQIPQKLYGRTQDIRKLLRSFKQVSEGRNKLLLVAGYSGVGKSSLVYEVYKPITEKRGFFLRGKFDQNQRNIPYLAISQALGKFVSMILTEPEEVLNEWRETILEEIGPLGDVLTKIIPSLTHIIGKQPEVPSLGGMEAQNRFNFVFRKFIGVIAKKEHPLVLFLDDLQWIDMASLNVLKLLLSDPDLSYFLLIGAYRDNEVDTSHPLSIALEALKKGGIEADMLKLGDLSEKDVNTLIADSLRCDSANCRSFSELVFSKTAGNAFFVHQMLESLNHEKLLQFDYDKLSWRWDIERIRSRNITDNVVELMVEKVQRLSKTSLKFLKLGSCIGNTFDLTTLGIVAEESGSVIKKELEKAVYEKLIFPQKDEYRFSHDRIQQATYSLISEATKESTHLQIGRLFLHQISEKEKKKRIYDIVNQLNLGKNLLKTEADKFELANLNMIAGEKARFNAAYDSAVNYSRIALELLPENCWKNEYDLTFSVYRECAEFEFLVNNQERSIELFEILQHKTKTILEKADILATRVTHYVSWGKHAEAIAMGIEGLRLCDVEYPKIDQEENFNAALGKETELFEKSIEQIEISSLLDVPKMKDPALIIAMKILPTMAMSGYLSGLPNVFILCVLKGVNLSIKYGQIDFSSYMYGWQGLLLASQGRYKEGVAFGKLALEISNRYPNCREKSMTHNVVGTAVLHYGEHFKNTIPVLSQGIQKGFESGDILAAAFNAGNIPVQLLAMGTPLPKLLEEEKKVFRIAAKNHVLISQDLSRIYQQFACCLMEKDNVVDLSDESFDEPFMERTRACNHITFLLHFRMQMEFWFGNFQKAWEESKKAEEVLAFTPGYNIVNYHYFFKALILLQLYPEADDSEKETMHQQIIEAKDIVEALKDACPINFQHLALLVQAEFSRVMDKISDSITLYEQAIGFAKKNDFIQIVALANELAARFYLSQNAQKAAQFYMVESHYYYRLWGANTKIKKLEKIWPQWLKQESNVSLTQAAQGTTSGTSLLANLDINTVIKASEAISGEIVLGALLKKMMKIVIENAGAEKGYLVLRREKDWLIEAEVMIDEAEVQILQSLNVEDSEDIIPKSVVYYVVRTKKRVVLNNAAEEGSFTQDPYIVRNETKSILCMPLINHGELSGILYLENGLSSHVFTIERLGLMNVLSSQMAIALDNARLYDELEQRVEQRTRELNIAKEAAEEAKLTAESANNAKSEFLANMSHELRTPMNAILGFTEIVKERVEDRQCSKFLQVVHSSGKSLLTLINDILDLSKVEAGKMNLEFEVVSLIEQLYEIQEIFGQKIQEKGLKLVLKIPETVPTGLMLDQVRLRQILINLVGNAIKFTHEGYIKVAVECDTKSKNNGSVDLYLSVIDTGVGIPVDQQERIFEVFSQVEGQKTSQYGGTGLGLTITKRLAELMNGSITVESEVGDGSTFKVFLEDVKIASESDMAEIKEKGIDISHINFQKSTVLIVDDIEYNRELLKGYLEKYDFEMAEAKNGLEVLEYLENNAPDLILLDLQMPVMDGYETVENINQNEEWNKIPIIAVTSSALKKDEERIEKLFSGYLRKPLSRESLIQELIRILPQEIQTTPEQESKEEIEESVEVKKVSLSEKRVNELNELCNLLKEKKSSSDHLKGAVNLLEVESFAIELKEAAIKYDYEPLLVWSEKLNQAVLAIEIDLICQLFSSFEEIIEELEKSLNGSSSE